MSADTICCHHRQALQQGLSTDLLPVLMDAGIQLPELDELTITGAHHPRGDKAAAAVAITWGRGDGRTQQLSAWQWGDGVCWLESLLTGAGCEIPQEVESVTLTVNGSTVAVEITSDEVCA